MKERPILMSAPMVRAILASTKTQTRRIVKHGPALHTDKIAWDICRCPYGKSGDRLWVRENGWERPDRTPRMMREGADTWEPYYYDADGLTDMDRDQFREWGFKRRPSIHMPRWASRITLEIGGIRVERLQDISDADAQAEGIASGYDGWHTEEGRHYTGDPTTSYAYLWESINGPGSWGANPWVWVIEFSRLDHA